MLLPSFSSKVACIYCNNINSAVENQNVLRMDKKWEKMHRKISFDAPQKPENCLMLVLDK